MSEVKTDCKHFVKWNFTSLAYSVCSHYHKRLIGMGENGCRKNCRYYKKETFKETMDNTTQEYWEQAEICCPIIYWLNRRINE